MVKEKKKRGAQAADRSTDVVQTVNTMDIARLENLTKGRARARVRQEDRVE